MYRVPRTGNDDQLSLWERSGHLFANRYEFRVKFSYNDKCPRLDGRQAIPKRWQRPSTQTPECVSQTSLGIAEPLSVALCTLRVRELKLTLKERKTLPSPDKLIDAVGFDLTGQYLIIHLPP